MANGAGAGEAPLGPLACRRGRAPPGGCLTPATANGRGIDVERQGLDGSRILELADGRGDSAVLAAANQLDALLHEELNATFAVTAAQRA
jgi:hypothetical protein